MGQILQQKKSGVRVVQLQYDTDMGDGNYYLYDYDCSDQDLLERYPPNPVACYRERAVAHDHFRLITRRLQPTVPTSEIE